MTRRKFNSVLITGASRGIGAALARAYAAPGATLSLIGLEPAGLADIAVACGTAGAVVRTALLDVRDAPALAAQLADWDNSAPFDLVIANAGIGGIGKSAPDVRWQEPLRAITTTNVLGTVNTIEPLLPRLLARGRGQITLLSSLSGFVGLPQAPAYGASKAWLRVYGESLRGALAPHGIGVTTICPGFIATELVADNPYPMPHLMSVERAVRIMVAGIADNRARVAFPWQMATGIWVLKMLPVDWASRILSRLFRAAPGGTAAR